MRIGDWMQTFTGKRYWPLDPKVEDICIEDIAAALSKVCRFGGHTKFFYSVAEHSVLVSDFLPVEYKLWGLLHDASEAYLSDIVKPLKKGMPNYRNLEHRTMKLIAEKFDLLFPAPQPVSDIDKQILRDEQLQVMAPCKHEWWCTGHTPLGAEIVGWTPKYAEQLFLIKFEEITTQQKEQPIGR